ncbi:MAG TPA: S8 family serine peptidase [Thermoanaerobaculia bacterium]|jgi:hypothetical protein|nr:S8 family serine peptidase [Thermoanaerobaculia bacterium]
MSRYSSFTARRVLVAALAALGFAASAAASPPTSPPPQTGNDPVELIVLLAAGPGVPTPETFVDDVNHGRPGIPLPVPAQSARTALTFRASGRSLALLRAHPESAAARLERYVVLSFPAGANVEAIERALERHPWVLLVEENTFASFSVTPNDPKFPVQSDPTQYQWGSHALNLPAAWDRIEGHAYIGMADTGLEVNHPDLRAFHLAGASYVYDGGNFRPQLSWDFIHNDNNVDEGDGSFGGSLAGHGTHTSGIVAATANNGIGVAGACWHCSLLMGRMSGSKTSVANAISWDARHGAQIVNASLGWPTNDPNLGIVLTAVALADDRDIAMFASPGNDKMDIEFPASDSRVISVGGTEFDGSFWVEEVCPRPGYTGTIECGSNYTVTPGTKMQDLVAPAQKVLSTFYTGAEWNTALGCGDSTDPTPGYGLCTGTSMSAPYAAGAAGLLRSANPLLSKGAIRSLLVNYASRANAWSPQFGYGLPNVAASVTAALGFAASQSLPNRLTPFFSLYSSIATDFSYTTVPQAAAAAILDSGSAYDPTGPAVAGYPKFPGDPLCSGVPCFPPRASVFVFAGEKPPFAGAPPLVPLYRMTFTPADSQDVNRDVSYATTITEVLGFKNGFGYDLDGIEGYIYQPCTPEPSCIPAGAVRLYRRYNSTRLDYAIFPESELVSMASLGYTSPGAFAEVLGYAYPNIDSDGDSLIDGFELLMGTNPVVADSDGDGSSDGAEALNYPYCDPLRPGCGGSSVWVSVGGTDANDCSRAMPCRTFATALAKSPPGGEIRVLDSGDFGPLTINKAISVVANGVLGGIQAGGGSTAITVNAGAGDKVVLRGLTIDGLSAGLDGISFVAGGSLFVESCTINNFSRYGIDFVPTGGSGALAVTDTVLRNNGVGATGGGLHLLATAAPGPVAAIDGLRSENNVFGLKAETYGAVTIRHSLAASNAFSGFSAVTPGGSASDAVRMLIENSVATHNGTNGVVASGPGSTVTISNLAVTDNQTGLITGSNGVIVSLGNNKVSGNVTNGTPTQTVPNQ